MGDAHQQNTARDYYRAQYFQYIDVIIQQLSERFKAENSNLGTYKAIEEVITSGIVCLSLQQYPEINMKRSPSYQYSKEQWGIKPS